MNTYYLSKNFISFWMLILLTACSSATQIPTISPTLTNTVSSTTSTTPTIPPTPSVTLVPTDTATETPLPATPTLPPPLPAEESQKLAISLLENNAGCQLPCWWGITPGQTTWETALRFFSQFSIDIFDRPNRELVAEVWPPITIDNSLGWYLNLFLVKRDDIYYIEVYPLDNWQKYDLSQFLTEYGPPDEVWMNIVLFPGPPGPPPYGPVFGSDSVLYLYYQRGIIAFFYSPIERTPDKRVDSSETFLRGCFSNGPGSLILLPSQTYQSFLDAGKGMDLVDLEDKNKVFLPLDVATGMDTNTFYETYSNPEVEPCIETPERLWPEQ